MGWFNAISDAKEKSSSLLFNKAKAEQDPNNKAKSQQRLSLIDEEVSRLVQNDSKPSTNNNNDANYNNNINNNNNNNIKRSSPIPTNTIESKDKKTTVDVPVLKDSLTPMRVSDDFFEPFPLRTVSNTVDNKESKDQSNNTPQASVSSTPVALTQSGSNTEPNDSQKQKSRSFSWKITPQLIEDMSKNFQILDTTNSGYLTEEQAMSFFERSKLDTNTLKMIWQVSDLDKDYKLNRKEFMISSLLISALRTKKIPEVPSEAPKPLLESLSKFG
eukprot:TRINITY_DN1148_c0_g1_i3.p1 TRINITY_DN1148_c0_g1~~TRINITY_DN1148_c0_g1_i3.p1  ORF type:complete len:273 (-),score=62.97 TRINITY_DN1148_c0_g1_i3:29-847(-)